MSRIAISAAALVCLSISFLPAGEPLQVEDRGEPQKLRFEGLAAFTPAQIAAALETDVDFLLAAHPRASFAQMLSVLEEKITLGYQNVGFPRASVKVRWDEEHDAACAAVVEGPRYRAGKVEIVGSRQCNAERLASWITAKDLPHVPWYSSEESKLAAQKNEGKDEDSLQWKAGQPATFVPWKWKRFEARVKSGLAAQGFHFAKFHVSVAAAEDHLAKLLVTIDDEGPLAFVDQLEVTGSDKYNADDILKHFQLQLPLAFDPGLAARIDDQLRATGRFLYHAVEIAPPTDAKSQMHMIVRLRDNVASVPALGKEFSRKEQAILRAAHWFEQWPSRDEDLMINARPAIAVKKSAFAVSSLVDAVVSFQHGVYLHTCLLPADGGTKQEHELLVTGKTIAFVSPGRSACLQTPNRLNLLHNTFGLKPQFRIVGLERPGKQGEQVANNFSFGFKNNPNDNVPLFDVQLGFAPAAALYSLHGQNWQIDFDGPLMRMTRDGSIVEIEEATGRLVRLELRDDERGSELTLRVERGALMAKLDEVQPRLQGYSNGWSEATPLASVAGFALDEYQFLREGSLTGDERARLGAVRKLARHACRAADDWIISHHALDSKDEFKLPPPNETAVQHLPQMLTTPLLQGARFCFPRESPPWTLSRETAFLLAGKSAHAQYQLAAVLNSTSTGPISGLYGSGLFRFWNPEMSRRFARQSLVRTDARYFRRDLEWLLAKESILRAPLLDMATTLREFEPEELRGLASMLASDPTQRAAIARALLQLKADPKQSTEDALPATLEALWEAALKQYVERWLQLLSQQGLTGKA